MHGDSTPAARDGNAVSASAGFALSVLLLAGVFLFGCWLVGTRGLDIGTDTSTYAAFFERFAYGGSVETRLEPGFVFLTYVLSRLGLGVTGYQAALFALMLLTICIAARRYFEQLGPSRGYLTFLSAAVMLLFVSPMFVNASINAIRQGLAALLVFAALLSFQQGRWWRFVLYGALASSLHVSSLMFLVLAPMLWLKERSLRWIAAAAFLGYCAGLTMLLLQVASPALYGAIMAYTANPEYRSGVRIDFAVFSIFWYVLALLASPLVRGEHRERFKASTAVYLVMLLPFFAIGWGFFSNRYLLPAWLTVSLLLAAILCHGRIALLRDPLLIRAGLVASCGVLYVLVNNVIVI